jgi:membrane associated rhomboid family serine protease
MQVSRRNQVFRARHASAPLGCSSDVTLRKILSVDWIKKIKTFFKTNDALIGLIAINAAVFVVYHVVRMFFTLFTVDHTMLDQWMAVPADIEVLIFRPWTLISYMFFHQEILHILFNMLVLYWFGRIFRSCFTGWQLTNVYILGGLAGGLLYVLSYNIFPVFSAAKYTSFLLGASAGALAVVMAIACYMPKYAIHLLLLGRIHLIYVALGIIVLDIISISANDNAGGHISHLGGALFGYIFARNIVRGKDITAWFGKWCARIGSFFKPKPKLKVAYKRPPADDREYNRLRNENQQEIDRILDKISVGGYESLSKHEKETLFHQKR